MPPTRQLRDAVPAVPGAAVDAGTEAGPGVDAERAATDLGELSREQAVLDGLHELLDRERAAARAQVDTARRSAQTGTAAGSAERDALDAHWSLRAAELDALADRLCFGRLDVGDPGPEPPDRATRYRATHYIGRIGLSDGSRQVQLDWRAPVAAAFYQATGAHPGAVARRRHLATTGRRVTEISDEVFAADALPSGAVVVEGRGALASALEAPRTGRMRDIVATVQAEQDRVVRSPLRGVLVVQGGPGTGKTAVALHRAAYLLYTHRDRIARSGVLLLGPTRAFLDYVSAVLPSLGEGGVVAATLDTLVAGVTVTATEPWQVAALKGDPRMARVLARAVRDRQQVPDRARLVDVDGTRLRIDPRDVVAAQERARRSRKPHLAARRTYALTMLDVLAARLAAARGTDADEEELEHFRQLLRETPEVVRAVNRGWLPISPRKLVRDLLTDPARLEAAGAGLRAAERALLLRPADHGWTSADIPLLDEATDLLGEDDTAARTAAARAAADQAQEAAYAAQVLASTGGRAVDAATLARRYAGSGSGALLSVADRAENDPSWAFGHVVVDEAQELSSMAWRAVFRRCPSKSLTVVGDIAQTGSAAGAGSWAQVFAPHVQDRFTVAELTVNYRTPGSVMALATRVLAAADPALRAPRSARPGGDPPAVHRCDPADVADTVVSVVTAERRGRTDGTLAVVAPGALLDSLNDALRRLRDDGAVRLLGTADAKGLEFDDVVVVEPADLVAQSPRGLSDLYVALTRPTRHLHLVHGRPLPAALLGDGASARDPDQASDEPDTLF